MELVTQCKLELVNNCYKFLHPELDSSSIIAENATSGLCD